MTAEIQFECAVNGPDDQRIEAHVRCIAIVCYKIDTDYGHAVKI